MRLNETESRRTKLRIGKEIPIFIKNGAVLHLKKNEPVTVHFLPRKAARVAAFQAHFPARLAFKFRQNMHQHVYLKPLYPGGWSGRFEKFRNSSVEWL